MFNNQGLNFYFKYFYWKLLLLFCTSFSCFMLAPNKKSKSKGKKTRHKILLIFFNFSFISRLIWFRFACFSSLFFYDYTQLHRCFFFNNFVPWPISNFQVSLLKKTQKKILEFWIDIIIIVVHMWSIEVRW
jgi:hypothetical protein